MRQPSAPAVLVKPANATIAGYYTARELERACALRFPTPAIVDALLDEDVKARLVYGRGVFPVRVIDAERRSSNLERAKHIGE